MRFGHFVSCVSGIVSIVKGISNFDPGPIMEGFGKIGPVISFYTRNIKWYSEVDTMTALSKNDFP